MYARTALFLLSLATSSLVSSAAATPDPPKQPQREALAPRSTSAANLLSAFFRLANQFDAAACIPGALPLVTTLPRVPAALLDGPVIGQALSQTTLALADVCRFSVTGDPAGPAYTAFLPAWYAWYHEHAAVIASVVSACPGAEALVTTVEAYERCPQVPRTGGSGAVVTDTAFGEGEGEGEGGFSIQTDTVVGGDDTATATASSAQSTATTTTTTGAAEAPSSSTVPADGASRETGFMLAAAAAAGFVGLVAAL
ncbi:hypothetical protein F4775DRAFT_421393 [Biscogniauxia sp. FL1348]|nr:hypothetical protein F4775DRAFT_421393 [Biscogniauxia sp. FL1348]